MLHFVNHRPVNTLLGALISLIGMGLPAFADGILDPLAPVSLTQGTWSSIELGQETFIVTPEVVVALVIQRGLNPLVVDAQIKQAQGSYISSFGPLLPSVRAQVSRERFKGGEIIFNSMPFVLDRVTYRPTLSVDYQLPLGGKPFFQIGAAKMALVKARASRDRVVQEGLLRAMTTYFEWIEKLARATALAQQVSEAQGALIIAQKQQHHGFSTALDVAQAESELAQAQSKLAQLQKEAQQTAIDLQATLNLPFTLELQPATPSVQSLAFWNTSAMPTPEVLYQAALTHRADLRELEADLRQARYQKRASVSDFFPTVSLSGYVRGVGPNLDNLTRSTSTTGGINVDLLKNLGVSTVGQVKSAEGKIEEVQANQKRKQGEIKQHLSRSISQIQQHEAQMLLSLQAIHAAELSVKVAELKLKGGIGIAQDVIKARTEWVNAQQLYQTQVAQYNASQLQLLFDTGQLVPDRILPVFEAQSALHSTPAVP